MRAVHQLLPEYMLDGENRSAFAKLVSARLYEPSDYAVPLSGHRKQILQILAWQDINEQYGTIADIIFRHRDHLVERALELIRPMNMTWATVREGSVIPLFCLSKPPLLENSSKDPDRIAYEYAVHSTSFIYGLRKVLSDLGVNDFAYVTAPGGLSVYRLSELGKTLWAENLKGSQLTVLYPSGVTVGIIKTMINVSGMFQRGNVSKYEQVISSSFPDLLQRLYTLADKEDYPFVNSMSVDEVSFLLDPNWQPSS